MLFTQSNLYIGVVYIKCIICLFREGVQYKPCVSSSEARLAAGLLEARLGPFASIGFLSFINLVNPIVVFSSVLLVHLYFYCISP